MKVLIVHNRYRSAMPSGENTVVASDVAFLRSAGLEVATFLRDSDELDTMSPGERLVALSSPITGWSSSRSFAEALRTERPDVVHLHNPYPLISPSIIDQCRGAGVPVVATVHNYRLQCANGLLFRDGRHCDDCVGRAVPLPAVRHGCYRDSRVQSIGMAAAIVRHRRRWDGVARFIAISEHVAEWLHQTGVDADRIRVIPNAMADRPVPSVRGAGFLHAARLSHEKGTMTLLDAWALSGLDGQHRLVIAGDGPLRADVEARASTLRSVEYVGMQDAEALAALRAATAVCVVPSACAEPLSAAVESYVLARPVIATKVGGLAGLVDDEVGWSVANDMEALSVALRAATNEFEIDRRGRAARRRYEERYLPDAVLAQRRALYESVVGS